ncbi:MAG: PEP-CTERM sorting domain-containing protein [Bryobacterales bacterium]|nr:PEP-CTERM sorting domain-containing protein [Bryobacterales bacterium]
MATLALSLQATIIASLENTGVGAAGSGQVDPNWVVRQGSNPYGNAYRTASPGFPFPWWMANNATSMWVSPSPSYPNAGSDAGGLWEYRNTFDLTNFVLSSVQIDFRLGVDNRFDGYILNGGPVIIPGPWAAFSTLSPWFSVNTAGLLPGLNTLTFLVFNVPQQSGNPGGFRLEFDAQGTEVPEPSASLLWGAGLAGLAIAMRRRK